MDPCTGLQRMSRCWILPAELEQLSIVEYALDFDLGMDDPTDIRCSGDCAQLVQVGWLDLRLMLASSLSFSSLL